MQVSQFDVVKSILQEVWRIRNISLMLFLVISISALFAGWYWPRVFVSSSTVLVDEQNILKPLMEGTAVTTDVKNLAKNAKQLLSGQNAKEQFLTHMTEEVSELSEEKKDQYWEDIHTKLKISNVGKGLVKIEFKSGNPVKAQKVVAFFTDLFIDESTKNKRLESQSAYDFIAKQASNYHEKLRASEEALKEFRSEHLAASPDSSSTVVERILELQRSIEETELEIIELEIQLQNIKNQLSGEAEVSAYLTEEGQLQSRISTLEAELDTLRMTYKDTYPDVVILKDQVAALKLKMENVRNSENDNSKQIGSLNPLFQELRSQSSQYKTQLAALKTRLKATKQLLEDEKARAREINTADAELAQLTRDYEVNRNIYQRLLRQRENARVSMNIDMANQGLTLKIQEAAIVPIRPIGIRLLHIVMIGILLAVSVPIGLAYVIIMLDGRIRSKVMLQEMASVPVLGTVPTYRNKSHKSTIKTWFFIAASLMAIVACSYAYVAWLRLVVQGG